MSSRLELVHLNMADNKIHKISLITNNLTVILLLFSVEVIYRLRKLGCVTEK